MRGKLVLAALFLLLPLVSMAAEEEDFYYCWGQSLDASTTYYSNVFRIPSHETTLVALEFQRYLERRYTKSIDDTQCIYIGKESSARNHLQEALASSDRGWDTSFVNWKP